MAFSRSIGGWVARALIPAVAGIFMVVPGIALSAGAVARPWVTLGSGTSGVYHWWAEVKRPAGLAGLGSNGDERPCLLVGSSWHGGRFSLHRSTYRQCTGRSQRIMPTGPPLIATAEQPSNGAPPKMTTVGMVFDSAISSVQVTQTDGRTVTIRLRALGSGVTRPAGLAPLRYAAFAVDGGWCAERLVSHNAQGRTTWEGGPTGPGCPASTG